MKKNKNNLVMISFVLMLIFSCLCFTHLFSQMMNPKNNKEYRDTVTFVRTMNKNKIVINTIKIDRELDNDDDYDSYFAYLYFNYNVINNKGDTVFSFKDKAISKQFDPESYENDQGYGFFGKEFDYYFPDDSCHVTIISAFDECHQLKIIGDSCIKSKKKYKYLLTNVWIYQEKSKARYKSKK